MMTGGCLCGKVRYEVTGEFSDISNCHCSMCRRVTGSAFGAFGGVKWRDFHWLGGEELVRGYRSSGKVERTFCSVCGSTLQNIYDEQPDVFYLALGTADGDPGCRPEYHIFVGSKAPWFDITDSLPQNDGWADGPPGTG